MTERGRTRIQSLHTIQALFFLEHLEEKKFFIFFYFNTLSSHFSPLQLDTNGMCPAYRRGGGKELVLHPSFLWSHPADSFMYNVATLTCKVRKNVSDKQPPSLSSLHREVVRKCQRQLKFCHAACIFPHPAKSKDNNRSLPFVPLLFFKLSTLLHTSSTIERQIT